MHLFSDIYSVMNINETKLIKLFLSSVISVQLQFFFFEQNIIISASSITTTNNYYYCLLGIT